MSVGVLKMACTSYTRPPFSTERTAPFLIMS